LCKNNTLLSQRNPILQLYKTNEKMAILFMLIEQQTTDGPSKCSSESHQEGRRQKD
jgi:hypothetical protein